MGLSRRNSFILYAVVLFITLGLSVVFPFMNVVLAGMASCCVAGGVLYYMLCCSKQATVPNYKSGVDPNKAAMTIKLRTDDSIQQEKMNKTDNSNNNAQSNKPNTSSTRKRLHYLDNLKSILTAMVVIHHITCSFQGSGWIYQVGYYYNPFQMISNSILTINQSYFMCLFFFISAYFTPTSCDRKGVEIFLKGKLKRLGIPYLIYSLIIGPCLDLWIHRVALYPKPKQTYSYFVDPGPCWFLLWLIIFNYCYIIMDQQTVSIYKMQFPSLTKIILLGIIFGIIQLMIILAVPAGFIAMPITLGSLPFDILFFIGGVIAKRNKWLEIIPKTNRICITILTVIGCGMIFAFYIYVYWVDFGHGLMPKKDEDEDYCGDKDSFTDVEGYWYVAFIGMMIVSGILTFLLSIFMIQCTEQFWNFTGRFSKFLSEQAYCVYLIHPWIICPMLWSYLQILYATGHDKFIWCNDDNFSRTHFEHNALLWIGWIYTVCLSLISSWIIAWCIRRIPGVNTII